MSFSATLGRILATHPDPALRGNQSELARRIDADHSTISRLLSGDRNPSRATVMDIASAMQLDMDETDRLREAAGFAPRSTPEVDRFRKLPPDVQRAALDFIDRLTRSAAA
jgi:transcriptional regulator with XRE-family HTH domain